MTSLYRNFAPLMRLHAIDSEISMGFINDELQNTSHLDALMAFGLFCNNCSINMWRVSKWIEKPALMKRFLWVAELVFQKAAV